ncbi:GIY-YIG nuclease family protein [Shewanella sp. OMA3-2]|uniref:GIY-YIG nuclease family protein n=1 Tax=Shewanella sp. OMA3-2 TaxID=2908650 RepID=UPI001F16547B|nr:GIY-YIG nuclease family protein [Shewanella sp. OMA3-2]UJF23151.1 GIY-YIG nuclease family protein [Shewanella sp. OMA3-2]
MEQQSYVYILTNKPNGTLYIGVTASLVKRIYEHKNNVFDGFSKKYNTKQLVYFEVYDDIYQAITREKQLKKWNRDWKIKLIDKSNPRWVDLYYGLL